VLYPECVEYLPNNSVSLKAYGTQYCTKLDYIFDSNSTQEQVYSMGGKDSIQAVLNGYNSTIFAYGGLGSGKSYTMFGSHEDFLDEDHKGIIPRIV